MYFRSLLAAGRGWHACPTLVLGFPSPRGLSLYNPDILVPPILSALCSFLSLPYPYPPPCNDDANNRFMKEVYWMEMERDERDMIRGGEGAPDGERRESKREEEQEHKREGSNYSSHAADRCWRHM